jgi:hypothetical protein
MYIVVKYKISLRLLHAFLLVSKARTNKLYIFRQRTYGILYIYIHASKGPDLETICVFEWIHIISRCQRDCILHQRSPISVP